MAILTKISDSSRLKKQQNFLKQIDILENNQKFNNANKLLSRLLKYSADGEKGNIHFRIADNLKKYTKDRNSLKLAIDHYLKSLEYSSSHSIIESYQSISECYRLLNDELFEIQYLQKVLHQAPSLSDVFDRLFSINYNIYTVEERNKFLNELVTAHPNSEYVQYYLGESDYYNHNVTPLSYYKRAIALNPKVELFYFRFLDKCFTAGLYDEANNFVKNLIEHFPNSSDSMNKAAFFYSIRSRYYSPQTAITIYLKAIEINANNAFNNYIQISKLYEDLFQYNDSIKYLELALPISPCSKKSSSHIDKLASFYGIKSSISQKNLAEIHFSLAVLYNVVGEKVLSIQHFIDAIQISKKYMDAPYINLAFDSEIVQSKQSLAAESDNKEALYLLGCRLLEFNNFESASHYLGLLYHADKNYKDIQQKFDIANTKWIDSVYSETDISPARFIIGNEENY